MNPILSFGTYNVPLESESLSASYTAPSILPKNILDRLIFFNEENLKETEFVKTSESEKQSLVDLSSSALEKFLKEERKHGSLF